MRVLVLGGGGREHALVWKLSQSKQVEKIYCVPGNAGTASIATNLNLSPTDFPALITLVEHEKIDLTVVGPEEPLVRGIVDKFAARGLKIFGPNQIAAQLEGSKIFTKKLLNKYEIPTAAGEIFADYKEALDFLPNHSFPLVIKVDGLAAGKGVYVCENISEAKKALEEIFLEQRFAQSGSQVIIEDFLDGEEASVLIFSDSHTYLPLVSAQDHKRVYDGDQGPNTGGMGAYSPAPVITEKIWEKIEQKIWQPLFKGLKKEKIAYKGVLYAGLMIKDGEPYVLEFNVRLGDPEAQVILPRLQTDLLEILLAVIEEKLDKIKLDWSSQPEVCVVLAAGGYPDEYEKGLPLSGLAEINAPQVLVFHAGTKKEQGHIVTNGGRVLNICASGANLKECLEKAYQAAEKIDFPGKHYRKDIGYRALARRN